MIDLFDRMAVPAILYGAEIWGNCKSELIPLDKPASYLYRTILGLPQAAPVCGIHLELGRTRISELASLKPILYWLRLQNMTENKLAYKMYIEQKSWSEKGIECWASRVKTKLDLLGFSESWENPPDVENHNAFISRIKQRIADQSFAKMVEEAQGLSSLQTYIKIKSNFSTEKYLEKDLLTRRVISLLRLRCTWSLPLKRTGDQWICNLCSKTIKTPWYHFIHQCSAVRETKPLPLNTYPLEPE